MNRDEVIKHVAMVEQATWALIRSQDPLLDAFRDQTIFSEIVSPDKGDLVITQSHHLVDSLLKVVNDAKALRETLEFARKADEERKETAA